MAQVKIIHPKYSCSLKLGSVNAKMFWVVSRLLLTGPIIHPEISLKSFTNVLFPLFTQCVPTQSYCTV